MNAEVKERWVAALRSGDYKQGDHALRNNDEYCCLGVLCEIMGIEAVGKLVSDGLVHYYYKGQDGYLPPDEAEKVGLSEDDMMDLAAMNDSGESFGEIADYIEEKL